MSKETLDKYHWHEALDRTSVALEIFEEHVSKHPAVQNNPDLEEMADKILDDIYAMYNKISSIRFSKKARKLRNL